MKKMLTKKMVYIPAVIVLVIIALAFSRGKKETHEYVQVVRSDVRQEVGVTGKVKPLQSVALSFERGGRIAAVPADAGTPVSQGQSLLVLDTTNERLELTQAESTLLADQSKLAELKRGTRTEDLAILESKLSAARTDFAQARQKLLDAVQDSFTSADDAVRNYAEQFFDNPRSSSPQINVNVSDSQLKIDLNTLINTTEIALVSWSPVITSADTGSNLEELAVIARTNLTLVKNLLDKLALAINALTPTQSLSATTISTYRSNVSTARSAVNAAVTSLTTGENGLTTAAGALDLAQKNIDLARAGTASEQIAAQEAIVTLDQAKIDAARHKIAVAAIRAPFSGTVTRQDGKQGEVVAANQELVWVISGGKLEVEAFVPEVDIGSIFVGDKTEVTFDAFSGETFWGTVAYIDPAETDIDGVPTYKIRLSLGAEDPRVRPGMTANLSIQVAEHAGTLSVPYRALSGRNGERFVFLQNSNGEVIETPVSIGIRGINGEVEIVSGLSEGDTIAIPISK